MRKVYIEVKMKMIVRMNDELEVSQFINEMEYTFTPPEGADIEDTEVVEYEVLDSK